MDYAEVYSHKKQQVYKYKLQISKMTEVITINTINYLAKV